MRGNYFTEAGLLSPINFFDVFPSIRIKPARNGSPSWASTSIGEKTWATEFTRSAVPAVPPVPRSTRAIGTSPVSLATELVLGTAWQATRHITFSAAYSHFFAGQFIHQNNGEDADFGAFLGDLQILGCCLLQEEPDTWNASLQRRPVERAPSQRYDARDGSSGVDLLPHSQDGEERPCNRIIEWQYSPLSMFTMDSYRIRATTERFTTLLRRSLERGPTVERFRDAQ